MLSDSKSEEIDTPQGCADNDEDNSALLACYNALEDLLHDDIMPADIYLGVDSSEDEGKGEDLTPGEELYRDIQGTCRKALPCFVNAVRERMNVGE